MSSYAPPSPSWSRSSPVAPSLLTYNRIWAEVGMVVGDDVAIDAINEFLFDFTQPKSYKIKFTRKIEYDVSRTPKFLHKIDFTW